MTTTVSSALERFFKSAEFPVIFTGAGVSVRAGLPTWKRLIEKLADAMQAHDPLTTQLMRQCVRDGELTKAVDYFSLTSKMLEGDKLAFLRRCLSDYDAAKIGAVARLPFRELVLGGVSESAGMTELLWNTRLSDKGMAVRSYFTSLALQKYDDGMAMALPDIIEKYSELSAQEMTREGLDLDTDEPKARAMAFRKLGSLEENYFKGMTQAVDKLRKRLEE